MKKNSSTSIRRVPLAKITAELRRRKKLVSKFKKKRAALVARLARLDNKINHLGGV